MIDTHVLQKLQETLGGDLADLADIIESFLDEGQSLLMDMKLAMQQGDSILLKRSAHSVKSNARDLGAMKLAVLCEAVETAIGAGKSVADTAEAVDSILAEWESVVPALKSELNRIGRSA